MLILFHQEEGEEKTKKKIVSGKDKPEEYYGRAMNLTFWK